MKSKRANKTVRVRIFNPAVYRTIDKRRVRMLVGHVLDSENVLPKDVNVIIVDDTYITRLNREFFSKNRPTNVIAFDLDDVGEIYVSCGQVRDDDDLYYFIVHGLLHLVGYTHDNSKQEKIMNDKCAGYVQYTKTHQAARGRVPGPKRGTK